MAAVLPIEDDPPASCRQRATASSAGIQGETPARPQVGPFLLGGLADEMLIEGNYVGPLQDEGGPAPGVGPGCLESARDGGQTSAWSPTLEAIWPNPGAGQAASTPRPASRSHAPFPDASPLLPSFPRFYSRRKKFPPATPAPVGNGEGEACTPQSPGDKQSRFMAKLTKKTAKILPTPRANRVRQRARTPGAPPRRSRQIAGVEPEVLVGATSNRHKKTVMRALDILGENEGISQEVLDRYSKLFTQSSSLVNSHTQALAASFGWGIPDEEVLEQELQS